MDRTILGPSPGWLLGQGQDHLQSFRKCRRQPTATRLKMSVTITNVSLHLCITFVIVQTLFNPSLLVVVGYCRYHVGPDCQ